MITMTATIYITASEKIEINLKNLISMSCSIFDRSDLKLPSFGIISNTGEIEFNDFDGKVLRYAEDNKLVEGLGVEIHINNTISDGVNDRVGYMETSQWDYDYDNKVVRVSLKDDLEEWQDINVPQYKYNFVNSDVKNFKWLYDKLLGITNTNGSGNYNMQKFDDLDEQTKKVLENTYIKYPFYNKDSLWAQWTKLCEVCQLHIYKNNYGVVVCRYNGGN